MDVVEYPHKELGAEAYYDVMINSPMTCFTLNRLQSLMVGCETSILTKKQFPKRLGKLGTRKAGIGELHLRVACQRSQGSWLIILMRGGLLS